MLCVFLSSYRNTRESLGELKKLWKHSPATRFPTAFLILPNLHLSFYNSIETQYNKNVCYLLNNIHIWLISLNLSPLGKNCPRKIVLSMTTNERYSQELGDPPNQSQLCEVWPDPPLETNQPQPRLHRELELHVPGKTIVEWQLMILFIMGILYWKIGTLSRPWCQKATRFTITLFST